MNKTLFLSATTDSDTADQPQPEARMRAALGLRSDGSRSPPRQQDRQMDHGAANPRRHRFVQEGEVPVEVMQPRDHTRGAFVPAPPRIRVDETALAAERLARELAERALADATDRLRELQTKLGHAELARDEALQIAADRLAQIEVLQCAALEREAPPPLLPKPRKAAAKPANPRPRGRPAAPKPVKWWIKAPSPVE